MCIRDSGINSEGGIVPPIAEIDGYKGCLLYPSYYFPYEVYFTCHKLKEVRMAESKLRE